MQSPAPVKPKKKTVIEKLMTRNESDKSAASEKHALARKTDIDKKSLLILRHGKTALDPTNRSDGWLDLPLSDTGRVRLITAQQFVKDIPLTRIYAPDFLRTIESANIVASGTISHPEVVVASDNSKTWNLGVFAGTEKAPNKPKVQKFMDSPDSVPEGGESYNSFCKRFFEWFDGITSRLLKNEGPFLLVLSGSSIRALSVRLTGDRTQLDLDEGGLMLLNPKPKSDEWSAEVLFGHKDENSEWLS
jgi:broad specificity phosphatase PhoE